MLLAVLYPLLQLAGYSATAIIFGDKMSSADHPSVILGHKAVD